MGHEITNSDNVVLHQQPAWHGLGVIVEQAPTPSEALRIGGLDWSVRQLPVLAHDVVESEYLAAPAFRANVRIDTGRVLGIVGKHYSPVQNQQLADFAQLLAEQGDCVHVESAGSVRGGRSVWLLLKGESFSVRADDELTPYILVSNSHDGTSAVRLTPTTIRTVCANTLRMVLNQRAAFRFNHTGDLESRIRQAQAALGLYGQALQGTRERIDALLAKDVQADMVQQFFMESYTADFGAIPHNPRTQQDARRRETAMRKFDQYSQLFNAERDRAGSASGWTMFNAYSELVQHHGRVKKADAKAYSNLLGLNADRTVSAFELALSL